MKKLLLALLFIPLLVFADDSETTIGGYHYYNTDVQEYQGMPAPSVSPSNKARLYYNSGTDKLMLSKNGGAYIEVISGGTSMVYPGAGIALSTGSAWDTSITNNSSNWNTAYSWGNHATAGYLTGVTANSPLSGAGTSGSHLVISAVDATHAGYIPLSGTPAANNYLQSLKTTGAVSWTTIQPEDINITTSSLTNGTGFLKGNGSVISFDNSTYQPQLNGTGFIKASGTSISYDNSSYQTQLNGTGFVKASGTSISYDNSTYLTSVTAHNLLSATHGDTLTDSVVLGDVMVGNATPKWERLPGNTTTTLKFLSQTGTGSISGVPSWQTVPSQGILAYYLTNTASSIATYYQQTASPFSPKTTQTFTVNSGTDVVLRNYATNAGIPNLSYIPAGQYEFHIHADSTSPNTINLYAEIWEVNSAGVDIAKIGTTETTAVQGGMTTSEKEFRLFFVNPNTYTLASTASRIVCRVYAVRASGNHTVDLYVGGEADSYLALPSVTIDATNFVPYIGATANVNLGTNTLTSANITDSGLTSGRVTYASTSGLLVDSSKLLFDGTNFTLLGDNSASIFGAGSDAKIVFTGTQFQIQSDLVTATDSLLLRSGTNGTSFNIGASEKMLLNSVGLGIGVNPATALLHLKAGTTSASTAPLKFTAGTNMTNAEAGAFEWDGTNAFITQTTGPTRKTFAYTDSAITSSTYVGTTQIALNRSSASQSLTGITSIDGYSSNIRLPGTSTGYTTFSTPNTSSTNYTLALPSVDDTLVARTTTDTLTNKRITKRVSSETDTTSITPNSDNYDVIYQANTQATGTLTINADGGTPTNGQHLLIKIKSTNVQTFSWNAQYANGTNALPVATTGGGNIDLYYFIYDTVNSKWVFDVSNTPSLSGYEVKSNKVTSISGASTDTQYPSAKLLYDQLALKQNTGAYLTAVISDSPLSGDGTSASHLTVDLSSKQNQLNGTGFVKASGTSISYDNSTYITGNQTISLSGDVSGSGTTAITTTIGNSKVTEAMLNLSNNTTANASASAHGLLPILANTGTKFLRDDGTWQTVSGSGATTALDNLASVAINTSLLPSSDNAIDLGSSSKTWKDTWLKGNILLGGTSVGTNGIGVLVITNGTVPSTSPANSVQLYASDTAATYSADLLPTNGTGISADSTYDGTPAESCDDNVSTYWYSNSTTNGWIKVDFGVGVTKAITQLTILPQYSSGARVKNWILAGSNNDSSYTQVATGQHANTSTKETYQFANTTAYRYYRLTITDEWTGFKEGIYEWELMETLPATSELRVRDEAGNITTLSPHNFSNMPRNVVEQNKEDSDGLAWTYHSENGGKEITVDMFKAIQLLEKISGEKLIYTNNKANIKNKTNTP